MLWRLKLRNLVTLIVRILISKGKTNRIMEITKRLSLDLAMLSWQKQLKFNRISIINQLLSNKSNNKLCYYSGSFQAKRLQHQKIIILRWALNFNQLNQMLLLLCFILLMKEFLQLIKEKSRIKYPKVARKRK